MVNVEVVPSPNNHSLDTIPVEVFEKSTFSGALQEVVGEAEKAEDGFSNTVIVLDFDAWHPPKLLDKVTRYIPAAV